MLSTQPRLTASPGIPHTMLLASSWAFGILFGRNVKFYVYPSLYRGTKDIYGLVDFELPERQRSLLQYLVDNNKLEAVENISPENLNIISDDVLEMIRTGAPGWEALVPQKVSSEIKKKGLFDYIPQVSEKA